MKENKQKNQILYVTKTDTTSCYIKPNRSRSRKKTFKFNIFIKALSFLKQMLGQLHVNYMNRKYFENYISERGQKDKTRGH
jgi:hypothetical protein